MITQSKLKKLFNYNKNTGSFIRLTSTNRSKKGTIAGAVSGRGYIYISIKSKSYSAHRLAWLYEYGEFPNNEVDHLNHDRTDNRISNLRIVDRHENMKNKKCYKNNLSGVVGVYWNKREDRWKAELRVKGKRVHSSSHSKFSDAVDARKMAEVEHKFHRNHGKKDNK